MNWEQVTDELNKPLERGAVKQRQQGTFKLSYIEGWHAIAEANRIFGHGNWDRETVEMLSCGQPYQNDKQNWVVNYVCRVRISVNAGSVSRDGSGFGSGIDRDPGRAHESAIKEAETDATKRALMTFGWPFGLALYDKTQEHVSDGETRGADAARTPEASSGNGSKYGPGEFSSGKSDVSAAKSKTAWSVLDANMLTNKSPAELNKWWFDHKKEIWKSMSEEFAWRFYMKMLERGADISKSKLELDLFWSQHVDIGLPALKEKNRDNHDVVVDYLSDRATKLGAETINAG